MDELGRLRQEIDSLDDQIVRLLNARAKTVVEVGQLKRSSGTGVFAADRERAVLDRILSLSTGPLSKESLLAIYRELMSASFALQRPPRVGYLGPQGTYSHEAAMGKFGASVEYEPLTSIRAVFDEMARGHIDYGIVPVENNTGGAVVDTLDAFAESDVRVCCEIRRAIRHNLLGKCSQDEIEVVYSRPEALEQCGRWLTQTGLVTKGSPTSSTSKAAEMAAGQKRAAAIGSTLAAKLHGLSVIAADIQDNPRNATRFFVLGGQTPKPTGMDGTSLLFVTANKPRALSDVLSVFAAAGVNMSMITSRPSTKVDVEYNFFADVDGHVEDEAVGKAMKEAESHCRTLRVLGSYPRAREVVG